MEKEREKSQLTLSLHDYLGVRVRQTTEKVLVILVKMKDGT
jgi:hypothetical protein